MEIVVKVNKISDINRLTNADAYLISNKDFSYRYDKSFSLKDIIKTKDYCLKNNKKLYMLINKIFVDEELDNLEKFLINLKTIDIDGIFFTDFAVFMLAKKLNIENKCFFYHETFLRNTYDILTYQECGINNIICSKDMNLEDINKLPISRKQSYGIICFGYMPIYESKRQIISNYAKLNNLPSSITKSKTLSLKEETRDDLYKVLEQNNTASIFNSEVLCYLSYMDKLTNNINYFIIDSLFFDVDYIFDVINLFKHNGTMDQLIKLDENIKFSDGFLNHRIGLM